MPECVILVSYMFKKLRYRNMLFRYPRLKKHIYHNMLFRYPGFLNYALLVMLPVWPTWLYSIGTSVGKIVPTRHPKDNKRHPQGTPKAPKGAPGCPKDSKRSQQNSRKFQKGGPEKGAPTKPKWCMYESLYFSKN